MYTHLKKFSYMESRRKVLASLAALSLAGCVGDSSGSGSEEGESDDSSKITKDPLNFVIQPEQLSDDWKEELRKKDGNEGIVSYINDQEGSFLDSTVAVFETVEEARDSYRSQVDEADEQYETESADVGEEATHYMIEDCGCYKVDDSFWVLFLERNAVGKVGTGIDQSQLDTVPEEKVLDFAELNLENFS